MTTVTADKQSSATSNSMMSAAQKGIVAEFRKEIDTVVKVALSRAHACLARPRVQPSRVRAPVVDLVLFAVRTCCVAATSPVDCHVHGCLCARKRPRVSHGIDDLFVDRPSRGCDLQVHVEQANSIHVFGSQGDELSRHGAAANSPSRFKV